MEDEAVIKVERVYKDFILPHERTGSVKGVFTSMFSKATRKTETQHALKDISFEIKKGEFFGIVGRNGSGKSTLLKILAGIYQPTKGNISTKGKLVPFIELGVGFNPELSGRDNVYLNGAVLGFSVKEVDSMYDEIVDFAELKRFMDQKLKNYSSGMQVRLAFSMAVRANADILLIDEVLAVGDADFQRKCYNYFKELKKNKKTVVFVSHDMSAVREYCDRAMLIESSSVLQIGDTEKVAEFYTKLFNVQQPTEDNKQEDAQDRWGNGLAKTTKVSIKIDQEEIVITQTIQAKSYIEKPVLGLRIRGADGKSLTGTNSKIEKCPCPSLNKGESFSIVWRMLNVFSDGEYLLDPAIVESDGITVVDWWDDAKRFVIKKHRRIPYPIDPKFTVSIMKQKNQTVSGKIQ